MQKCKLLPGEFDDEYIFQNVNGIFIDTSNQFINITLADFLNIHDIILDDDASFCRIIRFIDHYTYTYEFRCHGGKIRVNYHKRKTL